MSELSDDEFNEFCERAEMEERRACAEFERKEINKKRKELEEKLLAVRGHKDAIMELLNDMDLNHDMNACCGFVGRKLDSYGYEFTNKEAYEYSDSVNARTYRDAKGMWRPDEQLKDDNLAFRARRIAGVFATLADTLALLDGYEEYMNN